MRIFRIYNLRIDKDLCILWQNTAKSVLLEILTRKTEISMKSLSISTLITAAFACFMLTACDSSEEDVVPQMTR